MLRVSSIANLLSPSKSIKQEKEFQVTTHIRKYRLHVDLHVCTYI